MAEYKEFVIKCRSHNQEICKLYCKDCTDFICLQCLEGPHESHTLISIKGADADIRKELKNFVDAKEGECISLNSLSDAANHRRKQLETDKVSVIEEIDSAVERIIQKVQESKTAILVEFDDIVCNLNKEIDSVQSRMEILGAMIAEKDINSMDFHDALKLFAETRDFVPAHNAALGKSIPKFVPSIDISISLGNFEIEDHESKEITELSKPQNKFEESPDESASDEVLEETKPTTIQGEGLKHISFITPISNEEAWIINRTSNTNKIELQKLLNYEIEKTEYKSFETKPNSFKLMSNGDFLTAWVSDLSITRISKDMRSVPFTHLADKRPYCLASLDDDVFVYVCKHDGNWFIGFENIIQFDTNGMKTNVLAVPECFKNQTPKLVEVKRSDENFIFHYILLSTRSGPFRETLCLLKQCTETGTFECLSTFSGVFGESPSTKFSCSGFCIDGDNIIVSDQKYKCVYILDGKDLKFNKILINNTDFKLDGMSCVAVSDDFLWLVEDNKKVLKFRYDRKKKELYL